MGGEDTVPPGRKIGDVLLAVGVVLYALTRRASRGTRTRVDLTRSPSEGARRP